MQEFRYEAAGVRLYAKQQGSGRAIVMLHGGGADHRACLACVAPISARYHVVVPDLRGSGRSWCADQLTWDRLAEDVHGLLDHIGAGRAVVGGISMGSGVALRFARRFPERTAGLVALAPVYGGEELGFTRYQAATFASLGPVLARAPQEGIEAFRPLYQKSPAMEAYFDGMIGSLDLASFIATNQFMASGAQPFASARDLESIAAPALLVRGNDPMHPPEISDLYAARIVRCTTVDLSNKSDDENRNAAIAAAIEDFCERSAVW
ncbi:MAG TPA: alpha/beta hydrolase [Candidatus Acidoferrales bacterium]